MEAFFLRALTEQAAAHGFSFMLMLFAIWWLNKKQIASDTKRDAERKEYIEAFEEERKGRLDDMLANQRACVEDRMRLAEKCDLLSKQIVDILQAQRDRRANTSPVQVQQ